MRALTLSVLLIVALAGCRETTSVEWNGVSVVVRDQGLDVRSERDERLGVFAVNQNYAGQVIWTRCTETTEACLRVPARGTFYVPFSEVREYDPNAAIVVYTWTVENGEAVDIASIAVTQ
jgi:hypothetical protein